MFYRDKNPKIVEAYQYTGDNEEELSKWLGRNIEIKRANILKNPINNKNGRYIEIEGVFARPSVNDWIIKENDDIYIYADKAFHDRFEEDISFTKTVSGVSDYWISNYTNEYVCSDCGGRFSGIHFCVGKTKNSDSNFVKFW
jgi:hypothetical protein